MCGHVCTRSIKVVSALFSAAEITAATRSTPGIQQDGVAKEIINWLVRLTLAAWSCLVISTVINAS